MQVWAFNDEYSRTEVKPIPSEEQSYIISIIDTLLAQNEMDDLIKAEFLRESGRFEESVALLNNYITDDEFLKKISKYTILNNYIKERQEKIGSGDPSIEFDKMEMSNIELFRQYVEQYIRANFQVFKKYKPTLVKTKKGTREEYLVNNKEEFLKINGPQSEMYLDNNENGDLYIKDFAKFIKSRGHKVEIDRKDPKIYYPVTYGLDYDFVNNELMPHSVFNRILEKEGIFVENGHLMVRQMQPTATGIPIEIYAFTKITEWGAFEKIQSAFFEHLFTVAKDFDLKIFQLSPEDYRAAAALHY
jgi:hypothetical protein